MVWRILHAQMDGKAAAKFRKCLRILTIAGEWLWHEMRLCYTERRRNVGWRCVTSGSGEDINGLVEDISSRERPQTVQDAKQMVQDAKQMLRDR